MSIIVDERYEGPPAIANGGYVCGLLAEGLPGPVEVRLHAPVPVGRSVVLGSEDHTVTLSDGSRLLATGRVRPAPAAPPDSVGFEAAVVAAASQGMIQDHPFPNCFVCGPQRAANDGLRLIPAPVPGRRVMATPWLPHESLVGPDGTIPERVVWAALDCPSYWPIAERGEVAVLGTLAGQVVRSVAPGGRYVVVAWARERQGRKLLSGAAVYDETGEAVGVAEATWIMVG
jgi:hypothetical protein